MLPVICRQQIHFLKNGYGQLFSSICNYFRRQLTFKRRTPEQGHSIMSLSKYPVFWDCKGNMTLDTHTQLISSFVLATWDTVLFYVFTACFAGLPLDFFFLQQLLGCHSPHKMLLSCGYSYCIFAFGGIWSIVLWSARVDVTDLSLFMFTKITIDSHYWLHSILPLSHTHQDSPIRTAWLPRGQKNGTLGQ